jgi:DNA primase
MEQEEKEQILEAIRKKHGIAIDINDPLFAIITANEIVLERQISEQNRHLKEQLMEIEMVTQNYLTQSKELLEKKLTIALQEAKERLQLDTQQHQENMKKNKENKITYPTLYILTGMVIGYTIALFIL